MRASVPVCLADPSGRREVRDVWRFTSEDETPSNCAITVQAKAYGYVPIELCVFQGGGKPGLEKLKEPTKRFRNECPDFQLSTQELLRRISDE